MLRKHLTALTGHSYLQHYRMQVSHLPPLRRYLRSNPPPVPGLRLTIFYQNRYRLATARATHLSRLIDYFHNASHKQCGPFVSHVRSPTNLVSLETGDLTDVTTRATPGWYIFSYRTFFAFLFWWGLEPFVPLHCCGLVLFHYPLLVTF